MKFLILFLFFISKLFSHHTGAGLDSTIFNFRFLDQNSKYPPTYFILSSDYNKGSLENRNVIHNTIFLESFFLKGKLTLNGTFSYIYYDQKNRDDAARFGKPFVGMKYFPFAESQKEKKFFFYIEGRVGLATKSQTGKFIESNYNSGVGNIAIGYLYSRFAFLFRAGGEIPLSRNLSNYDNEEGIPYYLKTPPKNELILFPSEKIELKKSYNLSAIINIGIINNLSGFVGFLYKTPFYGIEKETTTGDKVPLIFREASIGANYIFLEKYLFSISYRNPLNRGAEFRPYESSYQIAFSMSL